MKFSIVVPISERDLNMVLRTLPSWLSLGCDDVVLCVDKPVSPRLKAIIERIAESCGSKVRIVEVERSSEWLYHQTHVRREGFKHTRHDVILTGDIDLVVNRKALKAVELVNRGNVGLCSVLKFRKPRGVVDLWRVFILYFLRKILHWFTDPLMATTTFTGLYCISKKAWLDSEPEWAAKLLVNPKQFYREGQISFERFSACTGEDTLLHYWMKKKFRCCYLRDVGAVDLGVPIENLPLVQYMTGRYFASLGRGFFVSLGRAVLRAQPYYLKGYLAYSE